MQVAYGATPSPGDCVLAGGLASEHIKAFMALAGPREVCGAEPALHKIYLKAELCWVPQHAIARQKQPMLPWSDVITSCVGLCD